MIKGVEHSLNTTSPISSCRMLDNNQFIRLMSIRAQWGLVGVLQQPLLPVSRTSSKSCLRCAFRQSDHKFDFICTPAVAQSDHLAFIIGDDKVKTTTVDGVPKCLRRFSFIQVNLKGEKVQLEPMDSTMLETDLKQHFHT